MLDHEISDLLISKTYIGMTDSQLVKDRLQSAANGSRRRKKYDEIKLCQSEYISGNQSSPKLRKFSDGLHMRPTPGAYATRGAHIMRPMGAPGLHNMRPMWACAPRVRPTPGAYAPRGMHTRAPGWVFLKLGGRSPVKYHRFRFIEVPLNSQFI